MKPTPRRDPPPTTIGDAIGWAAIKAERDEKEKQARRRAELEAMGFKVPPEKK